MTFTDTGDVGNIAFGRRESTEDVAYVGRFDTEVARWMRQPIGLDLDAVKLAITLFLARYAKPRRL